MNTPLARAHGTTPRATPRRRSPCLLTLRCPLRPNPCPRVAAQENKDGVISPAELEAHFLRRQHTDRMMLDHIFSEIDDDHTGTISFEKFFRSIDTFCRATKTTLPLLLSRTRSEVAPASRTEVALVGRTAK